MRIAIEGNIGCGKTTLISKINEKTRMPIFLEPVDEWKEWLSLFYKEPSRWGMSFNLKVLMSFFKWRHNAFDAIYERSPMSCRHVFTQLQIDATSMSPIEVSLFDELYAQLSWQPDVIIYIRTPPEVCEERMKKRNRDCESKVPLSYLRDVHDKYENLIYTTDIKTFTVDGQQSCEKVFQDVDEIIQTLLSR